VAAGTPNPMRAACARACVSQNTPTQIVLSLATRLKMKIAMRSQPDASHMTERPAKAFTLVHRSSARGNASFGNPVIVRHHNLRETASPGGEISL
jgi:hypothetical protein